MGTVTLTTNLTYTPPLSISQATAPLSLSKAYVPILVGTLDIQVMTPAFTSFSIFSPASVSINKCDILILVNRNNQDMGLILNGVGPLYQMPAMTGGIPSLLTIANPVSAGPPGPPPFFPPDALVSCDVQTTVAQALIVGQIDFYVFAGD